MTARSVQGQDNMHVGVAELFSTLNSQLDVLTVENLLKTFVQDKGTGTVKPGESMLGGGVSIGDSFEVQSAS